MLNMESRPVNKEKSQLEFVGSALGGLKSHKGTFGEVSGKVMLEDGKIAGIEGTIKASSVKTDNEKLDGHLQSESFFDAEKNPEIKFKSTSLKDGEMTGDLTFRGVTKSISFPVEVTEDSISADFKLDAKPFGMSFMGVSSKVSIMFKAVI